MNYSSPSSGSNASSPLANGMESYFSNLLQDTENANAAAAAHVEPVPSSSRASESPTYLPQRQPTQFELMTTSLLQAISTVEDNAQCESPHTSSSSGSLTCSKCELRLGTNRCLDCSETFCVECLGIPSFECAHKDYTLVSSGQISPAALRNLTEAARDLHCEIHNETLGYYCKTCSKLVCQECTLWEHKDHITLFLRETNSHQVLKMQVFKLLESGKTGTRYIKQSIDTAVAISRGLDRDATLVSAKVHKCVRAFVQVLEDKEKCMLDQVEKIRQIKENELSAQMQGLRNALAGLAHTNECLTKALENDNVDIRAIKEKAEDHIQLYANMYKSLQPRDQGIIFLPPNPDIMKVMAAMGDVQLSNRDPSDMSIANIDPRAIRRPGHPRLHPRSLGFIPAPPHPSARSVNLKLLKKGRGHCIPNSYAPVIAQQGWLVPSKTFGTEGPEDGQVSRPWGLCVDRDGNIIVADRRNNRIQVFGVDGVFKTKFGRKGTGPGEFDLPAGITSDITGRIIVVDKDNHRVQIFTSNGLFILSFGMYGKNAGQFRYPWDVAVNSERNIIVTDTRNYRVQIFEPDGAYINMIVFDGINHNRNLKGLTTPRGICFTPMGDIIVSDFENHRLLLVDSKLEAVIGSRGYEGLGIGEFSRPSGIICDDEGKIIVADSKNHRVMIFAHNLDFLWSLDVKGFTSEHNDRPTDVGLTPNGRLIVVVEGSLDSKESIPGKCFVQIF